MPLAGFARGSRGEPIREKCLAERYNVVNTHDGNFLEKSINVRGKAQSVVIFIDE